MKLALVFLALVALSQGVPLTRTLDERIINGANANFGEIPYQVSLQTLNSFHFCGGSILNERYVITAAHCVTGKEATSIKAIAGTIDLGDPKSVHHVTNIVIHENYDPSHSWIHDIALLTVNEWFIVSNTIGYVSLPIQGTQVPAGAVAITSGWGSTTEEGSAPTHLQRTNVVIASQEYCRQVNGEVYDSHLCAHDPNVETGPCSGDSGGPLTVDGQLVGITSWVKGCASSYYPSVYTRVPSYVDWINTHVIYNIV